MRMFLFLENNCQSYERMLILYHLTKYTFHPYNGYKYIKIRYVVAIIDTIIKMKSRERCDYGVK